MLHHAVGRGRKGVKMGIIAVLGYLLSPLSWWNDLFVNMPLAYLFGSAFGMISRRLFVPMLICGYWLTNVLGLLLMHYGVKGLASGAKGGKNEPKAELMKNIFYSIAYTLAIVLLVKIGWLKFPAEYFQ